MRLISSIMYYFILPQIAGTVKLNAIKLCIDCKFFKKNMFDSNTYGKCLKFPKKDYDDRTFYIDGVVKNKAVDYNYCSIARSYDNMCGNDAKFYEEINKK